jgi:hypothetical protein
MLSYDYGCRTDNLIRLLLAMDRNQSSNSLRTEMLCADNE